MEAIFDAIRSVTLSGSMIILVVLALRLVLQKTPRWCLCLLWLLAFLRLILPFSLESPLSLQPQISVPAVQTAPTLPDEPVSAIPPTQIAPDVTIRDDAVTQLALTANKASEPLPLIWAIGACGCLSYALISYVLLKQKVKHSVTVIRRRQTGNRKSATCAAIFVLFRQEKLPSASERPGGASAPTSERVQNLFVKVAAATFTRRCASYFARSMYSPVRVSMRISSPMLQNRGTCRVRPVSMVAGL